MPMATPESGHFSGSKYNNVDKPSVVTSSLIQAFSWKGRNVKKSTTAENSVIEDVLLSLIPLIRAEFLFQE